MNGLMNQPPLFFMLVLLLGVITAWYLAEFLQNKFLKANKPPIKSAIQTLYEIDGFAHKFSVEHYPLTDRWYPKYYNSYIIEDTQTGILKPNNHYYDLTNAIYAVTEKGAEQIIEKFKEQQLKPPVNIIPKH